MKPFRIGVLSDTHGFLHPQVFQWFEGVDLILHAGDVGGDELLTDLAALAPVQAVSGNVDGAPDARRRPLELRIETPAGRIAMTHGHLPSAPSTEPARLVEFFRDFAPGIILYGHSHVARLDELDGVRIFNPGSAGHPRFGRPATIGLITASRTGPAVLEHKLLTRRVTV